MTLIRDKSPVGLLLLLLYRTINYLFITYIVTSNPKRISVAAGLVHIVVLLSKLLKVPQHCFVVTSTYTYSST